MHPVQELRRAVEINVGTLLKSDMDSKEEGAAAVALLPGHRPARWLGVRAAVRTTAVVSSQVPEFLQRASQSSAGLSRDFQPDYPRTRIGADRVRDCATLKAYFLRDFCGTLLCSPVLDACNGRPTHRFSINSSPTESNSYHTALFARFAAYNAGQPLQGECRRFDPVSTHHTQATA